MVMPLLEIEYIYGGAEDVGKIFTSMLNLLNLRDLRHQEKIP